MNFLQRTKMTIRHKVNEMIGQLVSYVIVHNVYTMYFILLVPKYNKNYYGKKGKYLIAYSVLFNLRIRKNTCKK